MAGLQSGYGRMMIDSVVWAQYINVTDRQTDRHIAIAKCRVNALRRAAETFSCFFNERTVSYVTVEVATVIWRLLHRLPLSS